MNLLQVPNFYSNMIYCILPLALRVGERDIEYFFPVKKNIET